MAHNKRSREGSIEKVKPRINKIEEKKSTANICQLKVSSAQLKSQGISKHTLAKERAQKLHATAATAAATTDTQRGMR